MIFFIPFFVGLGISILLYVGLIVWGSTLGFAGLIVALFPIYILIIPTIIGTLIGLIRLIKRGMWSGSRVSTLVFGVLVIAGCCLFIISSIQYTSSLISKTNKIVTETNINYIRDGLLLYYEKNKELPTQITTQPQKIAKSEADLCELLSRKYMGLMPQELKTGESGHITDCNSNYDTGYTIYKNITGSEFTISAVDSKDMPISKTTQLPR